MVLPSTTRQYSYPKFGSYNDLVLHEVPIALPKANEVLVKTHAVSLQYRDRMIAKKLYPGPLQENLVPCSDMAGEVIAVGADVKEWHVSNRVAANFFADKLHDEYTQEIRESAFGGALQGSLVRIPAHLSYEEASTLPCAAVTAYNTFLSGFGLIKAGDTILVQELGNFALQFTVVAGATVIGVSQPLPTTRSSSAMMHLGFTPEQCHDASWRTPTLSWGSPAIKTPRNLINVPDRSELVGPLQASSSLSTMLSVVWRYLAKSWWPMSQKGIFDSLLVQKW
ncbi:chaperonin 10-like protein [Mycena galopus ATCC 62051]|nr:chaperonin 10-like protein [Mycena galopus ATCC 62051]